MPPTMLTMIALRKNDLALVHRELLVPASNPLVEALQLLERETPHLDSVLDLLCGQPPCHEGPEALDEPFSARKMEVPAGQQQRIIAAPRLPAKLPVARLCNNHRCHGAAEQRVRYLDLMAPVQPIRVRRVERTFCE